MPAVPKRLAGEGALFPSQPRPVECTAEPAVPNKILSLQTQDDLT